MDINVKQIQEVRIISVSQNNTHNKEQESMFFNNATAAKEWNKEHDGTTPKYNKNSSSIEVIANNVCHKVAVNGHPYWYTEQQTGTYLQM